MVEFDLEANSEELEERAAIMASAEFNADFAGEQRPAVCLDCGEYGCQNQECFGQRYDLPARNGFDAWDFILNGNRQILPIAQPTTAQLFTCMDLV